MIRPILSSEQRPLRATIEIILKRIDLQLSHFPGYVYIKNVSLSLAPWTVEGGMLPPALKLKRKVIENKLGDEISGMYE